MPDPRKPERAIVLAAGMGSRLGGPDAVPKPLRPVSGVPLLVRVLRTLQYEGVREAVLVVGHMGERVRRALISEPSLALSLEFVHNPDYAKKNGVSLLAARQHVARGGVLLTMADHLYSPEIVRRLRTAELPRGTSALAVDYDIDRCFDLDDATKVRVDQGRIADIGKELPVFDAVDTGVFRIGPELLDELEAIYERTGDCALSDGVRALAARGRFLACDAGDARWIDVDTPAAAERAEAMLRVFGDALGDEPAAAPGRIDPEAIELFAPTWVRAAQPYREDHFELAAQRDGVARLMSNESPFAPSPRVIEAVLGAALKGNLYPAGAAELRRKLGAREGLDEGHVLLGSGSTELIDLAIRTFVAPGEEVLLSVPTFSMYEARTRTVGGIPVLVPLTAEGGLDVGALIAAITERTKLVFFCTPNNPTGNRVEEAALRRMLRLGLPTIVDEAYHELGETPSSLVYLLSEFPNAAFLRTFSKAFGLAGLRLGYALAHPAVVRLLSRAKLPWNVSSLAIAAASAVLDDVVEQESRLSALRDERARLVRELGAIPSVQVTPSEANFVLVDVGACGVSADALVERLLGFGVLVRGLTAHHAGRSMVRITVGSRDDNGRCVDALRRILDAPAGRPLASAATDAE